MRKIFVLGLLLFGVWYSFLYYATQAMDAMIPKYDIDYSGHQLSDYKALIIEKHFSGGNDE